MKDSTIEELAYDIKLAKDGRLPKPIVFLGAGASKSGDIPLASEIVDDILTDYKDNPRIRNLTDENKTYPKLMERLGPFETNSLLKKYITRAKINVTHIYLAQLLKEGYVDYVLTVNFDNLMLRALALYNEFPPTYDMAILKDLTTTNFHEGSVLYLHGQHHGLWLLNTSEEMDKVKELIPPILNKITNQRPWIIIGYSGADPIFDHVVKLGRFDNGLYWVCYKDKTPEGNVCEALLDKPNTNSFIIKGYDSDSFMLKLNEELRLGQPDIIDKPFTSLSNSLDNIVDIDAEAHFKGVRERLDIVKKQVNNAIKQFEEGALVISDEMQKEAELDRLKKRIIEEIIKAEFDETRMSETVHDASNFDAADINELLANLYLSWADKITERANSDNDEELYYLGFEKYAKAVEHNPNDDITFNNWGIALLNLAKVKSDEELYRQSFENFGKAVELNPKNALAFNNWGTALFDLAKLKGDEDLYLQSFEKYHITVELNPKYDMAFFNWGTVLSELAKLKGDQELYRQSIEKYSKAVKLNPKDDATFYNWGNSLSDLAKLGDDKKLYRQSFEKYSKAVELNPKHDAAFNNWGNALSTLAKLTNDEELYSQSFEKYSKAVELNPDDHDTFNNWGGALSDLAKLKNDEGIQRQALEKLNKAVELGSGTYNLACVYALMGKKDNALSNLEKSLERNEVTTDYVKSDGDWKGFEKDPDFEALLKKYS